jgi:hypothetical protein
MATNDGAAMTKRQIDLFPELPGGKKYVSDYQHLVAEWHSTKNSGKVPDDYTNGSGVKVWWKCSKGHEWEATIGNRSTGRNCPYCAGNLPSAENNLAAKFPELVAEWDFEKNSKEPSKYTVNSNQTAWWKCPKGHGWKTAITHRTTGRTGCPKCYNEARPEKLRPKTDSSYNLMTENPLLCEEWDSERNSFPPTHYRPTSGANVWWQCPKGEDHFWKARIYSRALPDNGIRNGCPFCAGKKPSQSYNLACFHPRLAGEWHPQKNEKQPKDYTPSANAKVWWLCEKGHEWEAPINNRSAGRNCPTCSSKSSRNEIRILTELKALFPRVYSRHKIGVFEVDIFIPDLSVALEYDGSWWHRESYEKDIKKQSEIEKSGIKLLRVREKPLPSITGDDIFVDGALALTKQDLNQIMNLISGEVYAEYLKYDDFIDEKSFRVYLDYFPSPFPENSLAERDPEVAAQWHPTKNEPLVPINFPSRSNCKAWWMCKKGHEWEATISNRSGNKRGCPYCAGRLATAETCLQTTRPDLAKLFHPTKNGNLTPLNVTAGTGKKLWWRCEQGHEWQAVGYSMRTRSCPKCR